MGQPLAELAIHHRLPAVTLFPDFARAGGLLAYGVNLLDMYLLIFNHHTRTLKRVWLIQVSWKLPGAKPEIRNPFGCGGQKKQGFVARATRN
jgi:hypothetical protein